jgi:predicted SAM-dependent methyltransferase
MMIELRKLVKQWTTYSFRQLARELRHEARMSLVHRKSVEKARMFRTSTKLKLHLGSGPVIKQGWVNIDLYSNEADLSLDIREPWPFSDRSASMIYSEHVFEHFDYPSETRKLLSEAWRVLEPGGKFSLGVPDCEFAVKSYLTRDEEFHRRERSNGVPTEVKTPMDHLNYTFRQRREHKYCYDFETLSKVLTDANFVSVVKRPFDRALDSPHREWGTLYVDATKPTNWPMN